jgi:hypothetical protein
MQPKATRTTFEIPESAKASSPADSEATTTRGAIAWSSFVFALLQSICTAVMAINGVRLAIGIGSLVLTTGVGADLVRFHSDWLRIPMLALALIGSVTNLAILWNAHRLRNRPASHWRQIPLSPRKIRMDRIQLALSLLTLVLIGIEEYFHIGFHNGY